MPQQRDAFDELFGTPTAAVPSKPKAKVQTPAGQPAAPEPDEFERLFGAAPAAAPKPAQVAPPQASPAPVMRQPVLPAQTFGEALSQPPQRFGDVLPQAAAPAALSAPATPNLTPGIPRTGPTVPQAPQPSALSKLWTGLNTPIPNLLMPEMAEALKATAAKIPPGQRTPPSVLPTEGLTTPLGVAGMATGGLGGPAVHAGLGIAFGAPALSATFELVNQAKEMDHQADLAQASGNPTEAISKRHQAAELRAQAASSGIGAALGAVGAVGSLNRFANRVPNAAQAAEAGVKPPPAQLTGDVAPAESMAPPPVPNMPYAESTAGAGQPIGTPISEPPAAAGPVNPNLPATIRRTRGGTPAVETVGDEVTRTGQGPHPAQRQIPAEAGQAPVAYPQTAIPARTEVLTPEVPAQAPAEPRQLAWPEPTQVSSEEAFDRLFGLPEQVPIERTALPAAPEQKALPPGPPPQKQIQAPTEPPKVMPRQTDVALPEGVMRPTEQAQPPVEQTVTPTESTAPTAMTPVPNIVKVANDYNKKAGLPPIVHTPVAIDEAKSQAIADFYDAAQSNPKNPAVRRAYDKFNSETDAQFKHLVKAGYKFEPTTNSSPYSDAQSMAKDLAENKHLFVWTGGSPQHGLMNDQQNFRFRAVHDTWGHVLPGGTFGHYGEEAAYAAHKQMYSPEAQKAMATETRGQNATVHFSSALKNPKETIYRDTLAGDTGDMKFPEQKAIILPEKLRGRRSNVAPVHPNDIAAAERRAAARPVQPPVEPPALPEGAPQTPAAVQTRQGRVLSATDKTEEASEKFRPRKSSPDIVKAFTDFGAGHVVKAKDIDPSHRMSQPLFLTSDGTFIKVGEHARDLNKAGLSIRQEGEDLIDARDRTMQELELLRVQAGQGEIRIDSRHKPTEKQIDGIFELAAKDPHAMFRYDLRRDGKLIESPPTPQTLDQFLEDVDRVYSGASNRSIYRRAGEPVASNVPEPGRKIDYRQTNFGSTVTVPPDAWEMIMDAADMAKANGETGPLAGMAGNSAVTASNLNPEDIEAIREAARQYGVPELSDLADALEKSIANEDEIVIAPIGEERTLTEMKTDIAHEKLHQYLTRAGIRPIAPPDTAIAMTARANLARRGYDVSNEMTLMQETLAHATSGKVGIAELGLSAEAADTLIMHYYDKIAEQVGHDEAKQIFARTRPGITRERIFNEDNKVRTAEEVRDQLRRPPSTVQHGVDGGESKNPGERPADVQGLYQRRRERAESGLTPAELERQTPASLAKIEKLLTELPTTTDYVTAAKRGVTGRYWYENSSKALQAYFGDDAPRFTQLLASLSPMVPVKQDLRSSLDLWQKWVDAERPADLETVTEIVNSVPIARMEGRANNAIRSLMWQPGMPNALSGPKVISFDKNLTNLAEFVTNDVWMTRLANVGQKTFAKGLGYLAMSAKIRLAAKELGWEPQQVQGATWSFIKPLWDIMMRGVPFREAVKHVRPETARDIEDFARLFQEDESVRQKLDEVLKSHGSSIAEVESKFTKADKPIYPRQKEAAPKFSRKFEKSITAAVEAAQAEKTARSEAAYKAKDEKKGQGRMFGRRREVTPFDEKGRVSSFMTRPEHDAAAGLANSIVKYINMGDEPSITRGELYDRFVNKDAGFTEPQLEQALKILNKDKRVKVDGDTIGLSPREKRPGEAGYLRVGGAKTDNPLPNDPKYTAIHEGQQESLSVDPHEKLMEILGKAEDAPTNTIRKFFDRWIDVRKIRDDAEKRGVSFTPEQDPYVWSKREFGGGMGEAEATVDESRQIIQGARKDGVLPELRAYLNIKGNLRAIEVVREKIAREAARVTALRTQAAATKPGTGARFALLRQARKAAAHWQELNDKLMNDEVAAAGYSEPELQSSLKTLEKNAGAQKWQDVRRHAREEFNLNRQTLDDYHDEGLISDDLYTDLTARGDEYVRMSRIIDVLDADRRAAGSTLTLRQQHGIKSLEGSSLINEDPIIADIEGRQLMYRDLARNRGARKIVEFAGVDPQGFGQQVRELKGDMRPGDGEGTIAFYKSGSPVKYAVPEEIADAVQLANEDEIRMIGEVLLGKAQAVFQAATTGLNTAWTIPNLYRDYGDTRAFLGRPYNPADVAVYMKHVVTALGAVMKRNDLYLDHLRSGAAWAGLQRQISPYSFLDPERAYHRPVIDRLKHPIKTLEELNGALDQLQKIAARTYLEDERGLSPVEAADKAREYAGNPDTLNSGYMGPRLNKLFMFINAQLKGLYREGRFMRTSPKQFAKLAFGAAATAALLMRWNSRFESPENDGTLEWDHISDSDKQNYYIALLPYSYQTSSGAIRLMGIKIPRPHFVGQLLGNTAQDLWEVVMSPEADHTQAALEAVSNVLPGQVHLKKGDLAGSAARGIVSSMNPLLQEPVEQIANKETFTDVPIVPKAMQENLEARYQYDERTSPSVLKLVRALEAATGVSVSPKRAEHAVRGFGSGVADIVLSALDARQRDAARQTPTEGPEAIAKTPVFGQIARRFLVSSTDQRDTDRERNFYDLFERAATATRTLDFAFERAKDRKEVLADYVKQPEKVLLAEVHPILTKYQKLLGDYRELVHRVAKATTTGEAATDKERKAPGFVDKPMTNQIKKQRIREVHQKVGNLLVQIEAFNNDLKRASEIPIKDTKGAKGKTLPGLQTRMEAVLARDKNLNPEPEEAP